MSSYMVKLVTQNLTNLKIQLEFKLRILDSQIVVPNLLVEYTIYCLKTQISTLSTTYKLVSFSAVNYTDFLST